MGMFVDVVIQEMFVNKFGDYGMFVVFQMVKVVGGNFVQIVVQFVQMVVLFVGICRVEVMGLFLNFFFDVGVFVCGVVECFFELFKCEGKVVIEYILVNFNKELYVGYLCNVVLGDFMVWILWVVGYIVEVQNYIDDIG